jgi:hypothetical protein
MVEGIRHRFLVVDDDPLVQRALQRVVRRHSDPIVAGTFHEAAPMLGDRSAWSHPRAQASDVLLPGPGSRTLASRPLITLGLRHSVLRRTDTFAKEQRVLGRVSRKLVSMTTSALSWSSEVRFACPWRRYIRVSCKLQRRTRRGRQAAVRRRQPTLRHQDSAWRGLLRSSRGSCRVRFAW